MQFSTLLAAAAIVITATGMAVEQRDATISAEAKLELLRAMQDYNADQHLEKRGCSWGSCKNCYEKYPFCHMNNFPSTINWYVSS